MTCNDNSFGNHMLSNQTRTHALILFVNKVWEISESFFSIRRFRKEESGYKTEKKIE